MRSSEKLIETAILAVSKAATDFFGVGGTPSTTVAAAWSAVSVS